MSFCSGDVWGMLVGCEGVGWACWVVGFVGLFPLDVNAFPYFVHALSSWAFVEGDCHE